MTNVYLMHDEPTGFFKIGRSLTPIQREKTLLAQAPAITLRSYWQQCTDATEKYMHDRFAEFRQRGEWFELEVKHLVKLYWFLREHPRTDVVPVSPEFEQRLRDYDWLWAARYGSQNRYYSPDFAKKGTKGPIVVSEMEWHTDGQVLRYEYCGHPNDIWAR